MTAPLVVDYDRASTWPDSDAVAFAADAVQRANAARSALENFARRPRPLRQWEATVEDTFASMRDAAYRDLGLAPALAGSVALRRAFGHLADSSRAYDSAKGAQ